MKRVARLLLAAALVPAPAAAHPMGNFSVNRYARLEPSPSRLRLVYLVDFAEIPTFQEISASPDLAGLRDPDALGHAPAARALAARLAGRWTSGLHLRAGATPLRLRLRARGIRFATGAGGLPTMTLSLDLEGPWPAGGEASVRYDDSNAPDRLGWREVVLRPGPAVRITEADVDGTDRSHALTRYPADPAADVPTAVSARFRAGGLVAVRDAPRAAAVAPRAEPSRPRPAVARPASVPGMSSRGAAPPSRRRDRFADLVAARRLTPALVLLSLAIAFGLGGLHALSPGHGKTIVAAYLVGSRGTARHALLLGAVVTASHTVGVFTLGLVTLALSRAVLPEKLYPAIELVSGLAIVAVGATTFARRLGAGRAGRRRAGVAADHGHSHAIEVPEGAPTASALLALGVSGGILPCPSALVVLLSAIALHRVGFGLLLIAGFSAGLAAVLSGIGMLVVRAGAILARFESAGRWARRIPVFSALLIGILGVVLAARALPGVQRAFLAR